MSFREAAASHVIQGDSPPSHALPRQRPCVQASYEADGGDGRRSFFLGRYKAGLMTAKDVCVTAWHAT
eukprot:4123393-Pyramimonas_sp.AAC.1